MQSELRVLLAYDNRVKGMTEEVAKRSIDWLHTTICRVLALIGGEVPLRPDFAHQIVYYAAKKGFWIYLPTNGRLMQPGVINGLADAGLPFAGATAPFLSFYRSLRLSFGSWDDMEARQWAVTFFDGLLRQHPSQAVARCAQSARKLYFQDSRLFHRKLPPNNPHDRARSVQQLAHRKHG